jgi:hypothetical protein
VADELHAGVEGDDGRGVASPDRFRVEAGRRRFMRDLLKSAGVQLAEDAALMTQPTGQARPS